MNGPKPTKQATIRRLQDNLVVLGTGVIVFGVWTIIKMVLLCTLGSTSLQNLIGPANSDVPMVAFYVALVLAGLFELGMRLFVGLSARSEGFGKRKGYGYLIVVALMILASGVSVVQSTTSLFFLEASFFDYVVTLAIEGTSLVLLVLLVYSSVKLKQLSRATD